MDNNKIQLGDSETAILVITWFGWVLIVMIISTFLISAYCLYKGGSLEWNTSFDRVWAGKNVVECKLK